MTHRFLTTLFSTLVFCGFLCAQGSVSPSHFTFAEGPSNNVFPFGTTIPFRYVQVHDDVPPMIVTAIAFRHNGAASVAAHSVTIDAWMSSAATTSTSTSTTFDNNHGVNKIQVVMNRQYNHPASNPADLPGAFVLSYPLDVPFPFPGSASFWWEAHVHNRNPTTGVVHDFVSGSAPNPALQVSRAFTGCLSSGATAPLTATGSSTMSWPTGTGTLTVTGSNSQANGLILHVLGFSKTSWSGIPLPFLIPGSDTSPSGACNLYNDGRVFTANLASTTGASTNSLPVPATPDLNGATVYSQIWGIDAAANPLGLTTSNLVVHNFVAPYTGVPVARVFLSGSLGPTGSLGASNALVTRLR